MKTLSFIVFTGIIAAFLPQPLDYLFIGIAVAFYVFRDNLLDRHFWRS